MKTKNINFMNDIKLTSIIKPKPHKKNIQGNNIIIGIEVF